VIDEFAATTKKARLRDSAVVMSSLVPVAEVVRRWIVAADGFVEWQDGNGRLLKPAGVELVLTKDAGRRPATAAKAATPDSSRTAPTTRNPCAGSVLMSVAHRRCHMSAAGRH
jgi:precorrin-6x reductase